MSTPVKKIGLAATVTQFALGPSRIIVVTVVNSSAATAFVQLFNALVAGVTLGTTTPDWEIQVGAGATVTVQFGNDGVNGLQFINGIAGASTTTDGGAVGSAAGVEVFIAVQ